MSREPNLRSMVAAAAQQVIDHADELTELDQAIGDGDHGTNMKRGFEAVLNTLDTISSKPLDEALKAIGKTLVMTVGVRTEHLAIGKPNGSGLVGRVHRVEHLGDQNHVHIEYRGQALVTLADPHRPVSAGEEVGLSLIDPLYFDASGRRIRLAAE